MTDLTDPNSLADALDMFAKGAEAMANYYRAEQFHQSDVDGALFRASKLRAAAVLLRRQGEALAALTDAIGDPRELWRMDLEMSDGGVNTPERVHDEVRDLLARLAAAVGSGAVERPTLDDTKERSDG